MKTRAKTHHFITRDAFIDRALKMAKKIYPDAELLDKGSDQPIIAVRDNKISLENLYKMARSNNWSARTFDIQLRKNLEILSRDEPEIRSWSEAVKVLRL